MAEALSPDVNVDALKDEVAKIRWFHAISLGHGITTPGDDDPSERLPQLGMPEDLRGKSVLDIGAWDGFFSFEAKRRGASRVLATDSYSWSGEGWGTKAGFELARSVLGLNVEDKDIDVLDLSPETVGVFDVVLFLGVLYHMRHPMLALERVASVTRDQLILQTHVDMLFYRRPAAAFYPGTELSHDPTNWWGPNPAAVAGMLKAVGFTRVRLFSPPAPFSERFKHARTPEMRRRNPFLRRIWQDAAVFHAWR